MDLARYFSTRRKETSSHSAPHQRKPLPLLASPVNQDVLEIMSSNGSLDLEKLATANTSSSASTGSLAISKTSSGNPIIYKAHHEASTIELFYDLFFVANLAYFTAMHQHTDAASLINYFKLFTLLWFTWLSTTLFDVRFSIDCVWNRVCKAVQFGVMTAFVFCGPIFDKYDTSDDVRAYKSFAIVLCVSRGVIAVQYWVVGVQGRMFRQTLLPVGLSGLVHLCGSVAFLITHFAFPHGGVGTTEQVVWFIIAIVEGLLIFTIAIFWRIVSFKYTHLVERLQLLTLIIIGEGIIGMVKSVACITKGQSTNNSTEVGTVTAAVLLLYLLWMLYFDQLSHDRFGTVRQQIWSLLHYPLHGAILFCVEGNTSLIVWNSAVQALKWIWSLEPRNIAQPAAGFTTSDAYISHLNSTMWDIQARFKSKPWNATYPWTRNLTAIANYTTTYGFATDEWNNRTGNIVQRIFNNAQEFVFEAHADTLGKLNAVTTPNESAVAHLQAVYDVFNVTVLQFYIGAGSMLLLLAIMYWFNKTHKTKFEFGEMITRVVIGFALIVVGVAAVMADKTVKGFKFSASNWIIAIVVLLFLLVLALDNMLLLISTRASRRNRSRGHKPTWSGSTAAGAADDYNDNDTADLLPSSSKAPSFASPAPSIPPMRFSTTAYEPYTSPDMIPDPSFRSLTPGPAEHERRGRVSADSGVTLRDDGAGSSVYSGDADVGLGIKGSTRQDSGDRGRETEVKKGKRRSQGGYESLEVGDEYEGVGWEGHPLRVRSVLE